MTVYDTLCLGYCMGMISEHDRQMKTESAVTDDFEPLCDDYQPQRQHKKIIQTKEND